MSNHAGGYLLDNADEILEGYEARLGICHRCTLPAEKIRRGLCPTCRKATSR